MAIEVGNRTICKISVAEETANIDICLSLTEEELQKSAFAFLDYTLTDLKNNCIIVLVTKNKQKSFCDSMISDPNSKLIYKNPEECKQYVEEMS